MELLFEKKARQQLKKLEKEAVSSIVKKMQYYAALTEPLENAKRLVGYRWYRFRIGDYRVICDIAGDTITVLSVDKRDKVYKKI